MGDLNIRNIYTDKLVDKGLKLTNERLNMLNLFLKKPDYYFSIADIEEACSDIGIATIYRNIRIFSDCDIIDKVSTNDKRILYTLCKRNCDSRVYLICSVCGKIIDYDSDEMKSILDKIRIVYDFDVKNVCCEIYGYCDECREHLDLKVVNGVC